MFTTREVVFEVLKLVSLYRPPPNVFVNSPRIPFHFSGISCCEGFFAPYTLLLVWNTACCLSGCCFQPSAFLKRTGMGRGPFEATTAPPEISMKSEKSCSTSSPAFPSPPSSFRLSSSFSIASSCRSICWSRLITAPMFESGLREEVFFDFSSSFFFLRK